MVEEARRGPGSGEGGGGAAGDEPVLRYVEALQTLAAVPERLQPDREAARLAAETVGEGHDEGLERVLAEESPSSTEYLRRLEPAFVERALEYGQRHGITYDGWLQSGVDPEVLARAGIAPRED